MTTDEGRLAKLGELRDLLTDAHHLRCRRSGEAFHRATDLWFSRRRRYLAALASFVADTDEEERVALRDALLGRLERGLTLPADDAVDGLFCALLPRYEAACDATDGMASRRLAWHEMALAVAARLTA